MDSIATFMRNPPPPPPPPPPSPRLHRTTAAAERTCREIRVEPREHAERSDAERRESVAVAPTGAGAAHVARVRVTRRHDRARSATLRQT
jgi:hypothetical protein